MCNMVQYNFLWILQLLAVAFAATRAPGSERRSHYWKTGINTSSRSAWGGSHWHSSIVNLRIVNLLKFIWFSIKNSRSIVRLLNHPTVDVCKHHGQNEEKCSWMHFDFLLFVIELLKRIFNCFLVDYWIKFDAG